MRYLLSNIIVIGLALAFLVHFGLIIYYGQVVICEPYPVILALEITGLVCLIVFAVVNLVKKAP